MNKKDYRQPRSVVAGSALRVSLLVGSGDVVIPTTITEDGNGTSVREGSENIPVGGEQKLPDWN